MSSDLESEVVLAERIESKRVVIVVCHSLSNDFWKRCCQASATCKGKTAISIFFDKVSLTHLCVITCHHVVQFHSLLFEADSPHHRHLLSPNHSVDDMFLSCLVHDYLSLELSQLLDFLQFLISLEVFGVDASAGLRLGFKLISDLFL